MPGRGGKLKTVRQTVGNADIQEMFSAMMGQGSKDYQIVWPKFKKVRHHTGRAIRILEWLASRPWLERLFPEEQKIIQDYAAQLSREYAEHFGGVPDLDRHLDPLQAQALGGDTESQLELTPNFERVPAEELEAFGEAYTKCVESDLVKTFVVTCRNLTDHKAALEDKENLDKHILLGAGLAFAPFPQLPAANFKAFFHHVGLTVGERETIMIFLHKLYHVTHDVYEAASLPDVNVDDFVEVIMGSMDDLKRHIPRCDDAFAKIRDSVELLRGNFGRYHRDMKQAGNPSIIMENFVIDVSENSSGTSVRVKQQFKKIIGHYRKLAQSRPMDHRAKSLFGEIDRNFSELERREGAVPDEEETAGDPVSKSAAATAAADDPVSKSAAAAPPAAADDLVSKSAAPPPYDAVVPPAGAAPAAEHPETPAERVERKAQLERERRSRARARRTASKSIDAFTERPPAAGEESDLFRELAGGE